MNAPFEPAHSKFGGSVATRVLRCPASVGLVEKVPPHLRKTSSYAERGIALHLAMALLLGDDPPSLESLAGETFNSYKITSDDVETALRPAYVYAAALIDTPGATYYLEYRVKFPSIDGAFGTADLIVRVGSTVYVVDFKFGVGVRVLALYRDNDADVINGQLAFYGASARHTLPDFFAGVENIILVIVQPVSIELDAEPTSSVTVTHAELDAFVAAYRAACEEALSPTPRLECGPWCRFCAARPICPAHTGPLLDLAQFVVPAPPAPVDEEAYLHALARGLDLADATKDLRTALHDQAKRALEAGDAVPGYALSAGRAVRHWRDKAMAASDLLKLGLVRDDVLVEELRSPKQVETRAKARGVKVPKELISSKASGVSLVKAENARSLVLGRDEIVREFSEALAAFHEGGRTISTPIPAAPMTTSSASSASSAGSASSAD